MKSRQCGMSNLTKQMMNLIHEQAKITNQLYIFYEQKKQEYDLLGYNIQIVKSNNYNKLPELKLIKRTQNQQIWLRIEQCRNNYLKQKYGSSLKLSPYLLELQYISSHFWKFIETLKQNGIDITFTRKIQVQDQFRMTEIYNITDVDKCIQKLKDTGECDEVSIYQFMAKQDENRVLQVYVRMWAKSDYPYLTNMVNRQIDEYEKVFHIDRAETHQTYKKFIDLLKYNNIEIQFRETTENTLYKEGIPFEIAYSTYITTMDQMNNIIKYLLNENVYKIQINRVHLCRNQFADKYCRPAGQWVNTCEIRFFRYRKYKLQENISQKNLKDLATFTHTQSKYRTNKEWYNSIKIAMDMASKKFNQNKCNISDSFEMQNDDIIVPSWMNFEPYRSKYIKIMKEINKRSK